MRFIWTASVVAIFAAGNLSASETLKTSVVPTTTSSGNTFDILVGPSSLAIMEVDYDPAGVGPIHYLAWIREGSVIDSKRALGQWRSLADVVTYTDGRLQQAFFGGGVLRANTTYQLFFSINASFQPAMFGNAVQLLDDSPSSAAGSIVATDEHLTIFSGYGTAALYGADYGLRDNWILPDLLAPRAWSGAISYSLTPSSPAPEPTTWALVISGFGLLGVTVRRRQRESIPFA